MSQLFDLRQALADQIVALNIGWTVETILLKRQTDLFNDIATRLSGAKHGAVLHIGIAEGTATDDASLEMEITLPLTLICKPALVKGATPEEDLWEALVTAVHDLRLTPAEPFSHRLRFASFSDIEIESDKGSAWLGRQTLFKRRLSL